VYPKNTASPRAIYAKVVNASDGAPITSSVAAYHVEGTTRTSGDNSASHVANGLWAYTPSQAETNYDAFAIEFYHADAVGDGPIVEVVTETTKTLLDSCAPILIGTVSGAQTGTEVFTYGGVTQTATCDALGNRTVAES